MTDEFLSNLDNGMLRSPGHNTCANVCTYDASPEKCMHVTDTISKQSRAENCRSKSNRKSGATVLSHHYFSLHDVHVPADKANNLSWIIHKCNMRLKRGVAVEPLPIAGVISGKKH